MNMYYNNKRLLLSVFWVVLGTILLGLSIAEIIDQSLYAGMGGAMMTIGILQVVRNLRYRNDQEYKEKVDEFLKTTKIPKFIARAFFLDEYPEDNKPVEPEPTTGLTTGKILTRMKKLLAIRDDDEMDSEELDDEVLALFDENPDTSIAKTFKKYMGDLSKLFFTDNIFLYVLICRYWFDDDDMVGWHNVDDYLDEDDLDDLRTDSKTERLYLQRKKSLNLPVMTEC